MNRIGDYAAVLSPRRIAIDATPVSPRATGATRVLTNLLAVLPAVAPENQYLALVTPAGAPVVAVAAPRVELTEVDVGSGIGWELWGAGKAAANAGADILFTVRECAPMVGPPAVIHVFEPPAYRLRAKTFDRRFVKDAFLHVALRRSARRAAVVTAGSQTTAAWLRRRYGIEPPIVYPGLEASFFIDGEPPSGVAPYFVHLAGGDPRDNTALVLSAVARARLPGVRLMVIGTPERLRPRLLARVAELGLGEVAEVVPWVTDERLRGLYQGALAVIHPSRYEGFAGYPALEAMALGTPVVALEAPGVTEVLQDVALLIERPDPALLAAALERLADDPELRRGLARKGRERVRGLTWEAAAESFAVVFRSVA